MWSYEIGYLEIDQCGDTLGAVDVPPTRRTCLSLAITLCGTPCYMCLHVREEPCLALRVLSAVSASSQPGYGPVAPPHITTAQEITHIGKPQPGTLRIALPRPRLGYTSGLSTTDCHHCVCGGETGRHPPGWAGLQGTPAISLPDLMEVTRVECYQ